MVMVKDSAKLLKGFVSKFSPSEFFTSMVMRMVLAFICHRGRMSCSNASGMIASEPIHRSQMTRFLARSRWKKVDINNPARKRLLMLEHRKGAFVFAIDGTLVGQAGKKTQNTYSTGNRQRRSRKKGVRYNKYKNAPRSCHSFTFGLLITASGHRIPYQIPHYTKEYCEALGLTHQTTAQAAAALIAQLELPQGADVYVLGDTAYDAAVVQKACEEKGYFWIVPTNASRVFEGIKGNRAKVRDRLKDWSHLSLKTIKISPSKSPYADYRRLSRWRMGPKMKPRIYYAYQETREVHSAGKVRLVYSTTKQKLKKATPDDVKILMTNAMYLSLTAIVDLYTLRWQIEVSQADCISRTVLYQLAA